MNRNSWQNAAPHKNSYIPKSHGHLQALNGHAMSGKGVQIELGAGDHSLSSNSALPQLEIIMAMMQISTMQTERNRLWRSSSLARCLMQTRRCLGR